MVACAPLVGEDGALAYHGLMWEAQQGNDLVYSANSNVLLTLYVDPSGSGNALLGNISIKAGRGGDTPTPAVANTPGDGEVQVSLHVGGAGSASITATLGTLTATFPIEVSVPDPSRTTLVFEPNTIVAGEQSAHGTLWAQDDQGRSITGVAVAISTDDPNTRILPNAVITSGSGKAVFSVLGYASGPHEMGVVGEGLTFKQGITVVPAGISTLRSVLSFNPPVPVAGVDKTVVVLQVNDAYGNPIAGLDVALAPSAIDSTMGVTTGVTNALGQVISDLSCGSAKVVSVAAYVRTPKTSPVAVRGSTVFVAPPHAGH